MLKGTQGISGTSTVSLGGMVSSMEDENLEFHAPLIDEDEISERDFSLLRWIIAVATIGAAISIYFLR